VTYNVITRIKAVLVNALIDLVVTVICSPSHIHTESCNRMKAEKAEDMLIS
jgi:hypothetical protein